MWRGRRRRRAVPASSNPLSEVAVALPTAVALHARPAAAFVKSAIRFKSKVLGGVDGKVADAKSILAVLAMGATGVTMLTLRAEGADAPDALYALATCENSLLNYALS